MPNVSPKGYLTVWDDDLAFANIVPPEFFASVGERYATRVTYKQSNPDFIFRLSDVTADRRFPCHGRSSIPKPEFGGGFSKATFVCAAST